MPYYDLYDIGSYNNTLGNQAAQNYRSLAGQAQQWPQQMIGGSNQLGAAATAATSVTTSRIGGLNVSLTSTTSATSDTWLLWSSTASVWNNTSYTTINATWGNWALDVRAQRECIRAYAAEYVETNEERIAREEREVRRLAQAAADKERRAAAIVKADKLLDSILNEVQRAHVQAHGYFLVTGRSGKLYRIRRGWSGNVDEICKKTGRVQQVYCAHPTSYMPDGDLMAAQKLMLESIDEASFLRTANKHGAYGSAVPSEVMERLVLA